ncbi:MAG: hypothetical protein ACJ795_22450 [Ktedonobacteraceae bacterium]
MRTQSMDTSPEAERVQIELLRKASPAERFSLVMSLSQSFIQASRQTIRELHPELSQVELDLLFVELHYGKDLADRVRADLKRRKEES